MRRRLRVGLVAPFSRIEKGRFFVAMARRSPVATVRVRLTFPPDIVREPVVYRVAKAHHLVPNIRKARVTETSGEAILDFTGAEDDVERGLASLAAQGVRVTRMDEPRGR
jgi:hypothetical protein